MSYLLMQILVCLLIAGAIGLAIGWLLRGGCQNELLENDGIWETKLEETNGSWEGKIQGLMSDHGSEIERNNLERDALQKQLDQEQINIQVLESRNGDLEEKIQTMAEENENKLHQLNQAFSELKSEKEALEEKNQTLKGENNDKIIHLNEAVFKANGELASMRSKNQVLETELEKSNKQLQAAHEISSRINIKEAKREQSEYDLLNSIYDWKQKYKAVVKEKDLQQNNLDGLTQERSKMKTQLHQAEQSLVAQKESHQQAFALLNDEFIQFKKSVSPEQLSSPKNGKKDDLTLIKGIGNILEERLNNLGIYHFEQIASWNRFQEVWIDEKIFFPKKVEREAWVKQAKALVEGK